MNDIKLVFVIIFSCSLFIKQGHANNPENTRQDSAFSHEWGKIISLNGNWEIAEGGLINCPEYFPATVPVPGLVTSAQPAFTEVGVENELRQAFWYRKKFVINEAIPEVARLKIFKSMHGTKVWLNGHEIGESPYCFTPLYFDLKKYLKGNNSENEIIIRVGAHISQLPDSVATGGDPERLIYPPGIYDNVEIILSSDPYILHTQVVPDIEKKTARVVITFASNSLEQKSLQLDATIIDYETGTIAGKAKLKADNISKDGSNVFDLEIPIRDCKLWTPESPNLYVLKLNDKKYTYSTRFGMRTFRLEKGYTNRALLNERPYFIRGTNFAVHRFFEDKLSKQLPWDKAWVRKLVRQFTQMGMNGCRYVVGAAPEIWYDVADEEGLIVFDEYAIWYAYQPDVGSVAEQAADPYRKYGIWPKNLKTSNLVSEYTAWMQERWNHASVLVWDAQNETWAKQTGEAIQQVRKLDLSNRPWDNGWSPPVDSTDMREGHNYFEKFVPGSEMINNQTRTKSFLLSDVPNMEKTSSTFYLPFQSAYKLPGPDYYWQQPNVINEYSYLWLKRDGTPTELTKNYYDAVLGENASANERREFYAKYLAAITEFWRANRTCFGVLYCFGINHSFDKCYTSDNFVDVTALELDPYYKKYVPDAFSPLGICMELWQQDFTIKEWWGTQAEFPVVIINDTYAQYSGTFTIQIVEGEKTIASFPYKYEVAPSGISRTIVKFNLPLKEGKYQIIGEVPYLNNRVVRSYRDIKVSK